MLNLKKKYIRRISNDVSMLISECISEFLNNFVFEYQKYDMEENQINSV